MKGTNNVMHLSNEYFSSIGSKINNSINNINKNDFKELLSNNFNSFYFLPIDNDEIIKVTKDIKSKRHYI